MFYFNRQCMEKPYFSVFSKKCSLCSLALGSGPSSQVYGDLDDNYSPHLDRVLLVSTLVHTRFHYLLELHSVSYLASVYRWGNLLHWEHPAQADVRGMGQNQVMNPHLLVSQALHEKLTCMCIYRINHYQQMGKYSCVFPQHHHLWSLWLQSVLRKVVKNELSVWKGSCLNAFINSCFQLVGIFYSLHFQNTCGCKGKTDSNKSHRKES